VSFDGTGELKMDISIYSLKPLLTATSFEWDTFNLLFAIAQIANSIQFADMKTIICNNKKYWFPQKQSNRRTTETGKYIRIKSSKEIVSVHFYDHRNYPAYKVYKYGEKKKYISRRVILPVKNYSYRYGKTNLEMKTMPHQQKYTRRRK
jgi:hypothetical protein